MSRDTREQAMTIQKRECKAELLLPLDAPFDGAISHPGLFVT
jgi:hypothetical protein